MIKVTRLNGTKYILNAEHILTIESTPDSVVTMRGGEKYVVKETPEEIVSESIKHSRTIRAIGV